MKVMFEIYRDANGGPYRVVYFTELDAHQRDAEIDQVMDGEHVFAGFTSESGDAKPAIQAVVDRLNRGERLDALAINNALRGILM
jgi:hypothetical protein